MRRPPTRRDSTGGLRSVAGAWIGPRPSAFQIGVALGWKLFALRPAQGGTTSTLGIRGQPPRRADVGAPICPALNRTAASSPTSRMRWALRRRPVLRQHVRCSLVDGTDPEPRAVRALQLAGESLDSRGFHRRAPQRRQSDRRPARGLPRQRPLDPRTYGVTHQDRRGQRSDPAARSSQTSMTAPSSGLCR